ncbi:MAG: HAMP domain-containing histidine kinase [Proteobacteria bacterium]|uniref:sensor histidine kinase n=1 Tax=Aquabacterium sp. TaxID=1872578 RepID=UPI0035C6B4B9|nr:HAMP domain-containing histidine kinase [Pseudomonadota bacterium]
MSDALALIAHDLKNALGGLESELAQLIDEPSPVMAQRAHLHCAELRRQFIQFLTVYGARNGGLSALCEDESPHGLLQALQRVWSVKLQMADSPVRITLQPQTDADRPPAFWYFDHRLVQLALDAAIHNAVRFARSQVELSVTERDGWLVWVVHDDGEGPGSEDPGQAHATGLGTALAEAVASAHTLRERIGQTRLRHVPGQGTTFTLELP